jgi:hypothetical protein
VASGCSGSLPVQRASVRRALRRSASTPSRVCCNWATDSRAAIQSAGDPLPLRAADSLACTSRRASPSCSCNNARRCSSAWHSNQARAVSRPMVAACSKRPASAVCASRSKRAVRAWRLASLGSVCISDIDLAVMKSRVVLNRSGPDSGMLSSDRRRTGSGRWPAATAMFRAERAAASCETRAGERASAAWTACGSDSVSVACAMGDVARPIRTAMCAGVIAVRQRAMKLPRRRPGPSKAGERCSMFLLRKNAHGLSTRRDARPPLLTTDPVSEAEWSQGGNVRAGRADARCWRVSHAVARGAWVRADRSQVAHVPRP